jgi:DNA-binding transcriptional ArsR family regulator
MAETEKMGMQRKEAMKALRLERKETISAVAARVKEQKKSFEAVKDALQPDGATVPQVCEKTGMAPSTVLWTIMALRKYGEVTEGEKVGSYFRYQLADGAVKGQAQSLEEDENDVG